MPWIAKNELDMLNDVFEPKRLIPQNKKKGLKLRHISFYTSNLKAISNVCKTLEKTAKNVSLSHQYTEVLRKMGLINSSLELTPYGIKLLDILHYDDNRIIKVFDQPSLNMDSVADDIKYIIEFYMFCVVEKCIINPDLMEKEGVEVKDIDAESISNLKYFITNIIDTINEPTNRNTSFTQYFASDNYDFLYVIQGMNFAGFEIKRLFRQSPDKIQEVFELYNRLLKEVKSIKPGSLSADEKVYYELASYYTNNVQKDVRNRIKHAIFNYILFDSIEVKRDKVRLVEKPEYNGIIPFEMIKEKAEEYQLLDIYNMVIRNKPSKYTKNIFKPFIVDPTILTALASGVFTNSQSEFDRQHINIGDDIIFIDTSETSILEPYVYRIHGLKEVGSDLEATVERRQPINMNYESELIQSLKES